MLSYIVQAARQGGSSEPKPRGTAPLVFLDYQDGLCIAFELPILRESLFHVSLELFLVDVRYLLVRSTTSTHDRGGGHQVFPNFPDKGLNEMIGCAQVCQVQVRRLKTYALDDVCMRQQRAVWQSLAS